MENFFNYISNPLDFDEVDIWFRSNNIIFEKMDLFFDFTVSLTMIINETYLGGKNSSNDLSIDMSDEDNENHFKWCWKKNIQNFEKENIIINETGEHYDYFKDFFVEIYYNHSEEKVKNSIVDFFIETFDRQKPFTKSDLDVLLTIYKSIDSNMVLMY
jgi:hypothetical protein